MACGRAAEVPRGREPAGVYAGDSGEGRHRGRAQGKQGPGVRTVRRGGAARHTVIDAGVEDQGAADRQAALQVRVATTSRLRHRLMVVSGTTTKTAIAPSRCGAM